MNRVPWPELQRGLVAILRGLRPHEAKAIGQRAVRGRHRGDRGAAQLARPVHVDRAIAAGLAGFRAGRRRHGADVADGRDARWRGGRLMVSPNVDAARDGAAPPISASSRCQASSRRPRRSWRCALGASALKFFPASVLGPQGIAAIRAVLPTEIVIGAVGGVSEKDFADFAQDRRAAPSASGRASTSPA